MKGRWVVRVAAGLAGAAWLAGCADLTVVEPPEPARLDVRWHSPTKTATPGLTMLGVDPDAIPDPESGIDPDFATLLYVPEGYDPARTYPVLVLLHGAGGMPSHWAAVFSIADERGIVLLIPGAANITWDAIHEEFGPDIERLEVGLEHTFDRVRVDADRIALAGFSDGGTYALSVGTANGEIFSRVIGWSPGYLIPTLPEGAPSVFVSHGVGDTVIPVAASRDNIVPALRARGLDVVYEEFDGGHHIPLAVFLQAMDWFLG